MRSRNIKPGFCKNEKLAQCSPMARLLFVTLPMVADFHGRLEYRPLRIKGELFPYEQVDVDSLFQELLRFGAEFVSVYAVDGKQKGARAGNGHPCACFYSSYKCWSPC
jgi:hypothetical protein